MPQRTNPPRADDRRIAFARLRERREAGITLVELLVALTVSALLVVVGVGVLVSVGSLVTRSSEDTATFSDMQDAIGQLILDTTDGRKVVLAEEDAYSVQVVRASVCTQRDWFVDGDDLSVTTTTYTDERCTGGSTSQTMSVVQGTLTSVAFRYYSTLSQRNEMTYPINVGQVTRVEFDVVATSTYKGAKTKTLTSGAAITQRTGSDGSGTQAQDATRPVLQVATARVGVDKPVLTWTDTSPELTTSWTVYRVANPEDAGTGASTTWTAIMTLGADGDTFTDVSLPAGYTAQYTVQATIGDAGRTGPVSNQVATGLRPAAPTVTATGQQSSIEVSWTVTPGADSWDLYRDGALYKTWPQLKGSAEVTSTTVTWTDTTGVGHAHTYEAVAINRWERGATATTGAGASGAQSNQVATGTADTADLGAPGLKATRLTSSAVGAWSAPVAPTALITVNRTPADTSNPASTWDTTLDISWTAPTWTGAYADAAKAAVRYTVTRDGTTIRTGLTATSTTDTGASRGTTHTYKVTASTIAPNAFTGGSVSGTRLTWPAAPTCTVSAGGDGYPATRAATVTVTAPTGQTVTALRQRSSGGEIRATSSSAWTTLTHATTHAWRGQASNAAGYGPWSGECTITTATLAVQVTAASSTTWQVGATAAYTNGTSHQWKLWDRVMWAQHGADQTGTSGAWEPLEDGHPWRVEIINTDGYNTVTDTRDVDTALLVAPTPSKPSCWASGKPDYAPGTISWGYTYTGNSNSTSGASTYASGAGWYSCSITATNTVTDPGGNSASASSTGTGSTYVDANPWPGAWGSGYADGCPAVNQYITPSSSATFQTRRASATMCEARQISTAYGALNNQELRPAGTVLSTYSVSLTGSVWVRVSGTYPPESVGAIG